MKDRPDASPLSVCGDVMGPHAQGGEIAKVCHLREKSADPGVKLVVKLLCKFSLFVYFKRLCLQQSDCCRVADEEVGVGCTSEQSVRSQHPPPCPVPTAQASTRLAGPAARCPPPGRQRAPIREVARVPLVSMGDWGGACLPLTFMGVLRPLKQTARHLHRTSPTRFQTSLCRLLGEAFTSTRTHASLGQHQELKK